MAGYDGYSKSLNALDAEADGKFPLTQAIGIVAAAAGITKKAVREILVAQGPSEWHHTSCKYNRTNYYDAAAAIITAKAAPIAAQMKTAGITRRIDDACSAMFNSPLADRIAVMEWLCAAAAEMFGVTADEIETAYYGC